MTTPDWQKSSYCGEGNSCVNVASAPDGTIRLRESAAPDAIVSTTPAQLGAFLRAVKAGAFDHSAKEGTACATPA